MSTSTANYGLVKPAGSEAQSVSVLNANFDTIDATMKKGDDAYNGKALLPYWIAACAAGSGQSIPNTTETKIGSWSAVNGTNPGGVATGLGTSGTGDFTTTSATTLNVKKAGIYTVRAAVNFASNATGSRALRLYVNDVKVLEVSRAANTSFNHFEEIARDLVLDANDALDVRVSQTSGGNLSMSNDPASMQFSCVCNRVL